MVKLSVIFVLALAGLCAASEVRADDTLPFGLDQVHLGSPSADASPAFLNLAPETTAPIGTPITDHQPKFFGPYDWRDCKFIITAYFAGDRLTQINFMARPSALSCQTEIKDELTEHYAGVNPPPGGPSKPCSITNPEGYATGSNRMDRKHPSCLGPLPLEGSVAAPGHPYAGLDANGRILFPGPGYALNAGRWKNADIDASYGTIGGSTDVTLRDPKLPGLTIYDFMGPPAKPN